MKKINLKAGFVFIFNILLVFPLFYFIVFGVLLDWRNLREFNFKDFLNGDYQKSFNDYFKEQIPIYSNIAASKPNFNILTGQTVFNGVFLQNDELIKINKLPNFNIIDYFCNSVNSFFKKFNKPTYVLIMPTKFQVNCSSLNVSPEFKMGKEIKTKLNQNLNAEIIKLDDGVLFEKSKEINSFYRTSSRLNSMGAYLLYSRNMKKLGQDAIDLQNFNIFHFVDCYYGELYSKNFSNSVVADVIEIFKYVGKNANFSVREIKNNEKDRVRNTIYDLTKINDFNKSNIVFGEDSALKDVETSFKEKEKLLIFADDFVNNMMQFLALHYSKITVVNLNEIFYLNQQSLNKIKNINVKDYDKVLFIYNLESLTAYEQFLNLNYLK